MKKAYSVFNPWGQRIYFVSELKSERKAGLNVNRKLHLNAYDGVGNVAFTMTRMEYAGLSRKITPENVSMRNNS